MSGMDKDYGHRPVLLRECLEALAIRPDGVYVDGTLGRADGQGLQALPEQYRPVAVVLVHS